MHRRSVVILVLLALAAVPAFANHSWGGYHWARTSNPFTLKLYDNVTPNWEPYVTEAVSDWNRSTILDYNVRWQSPLSSPRKCASSTGVVEICNEAYGQNGWLGIAGISISGSHITKGYTKLNDTYFAMAQYNTPAYRRLVTCQEIAHNFGLAHQDETFTNANLGSCMDYTNDPDGGAGGASSSDPSNEHPNQHDFDMISSIYAHTDSTSTVAAAIGMIAEEMSRPASLQQILVKTTEDWGYAVRFDREGRAIEYMKPTGVNAQGEAEMDIIHVFWAPDNPGHRPTGEDH